MFFVILDLRNSDQNQKITKFSGFLEKKFFVNFPVFYFVMSVLKFKPPFCDIFTTLKEPSPIKTEEIMRIYWNTISNDNRSANNFSTEHEFEKCTEALI